MNFSIQPVLENNQLTLVPLQETDFNKLYKVASDVLIWEQHPENNRYEKEVFKIFFKGAIESKGAFLISEKETGEIIGSSRFYNYDNIEKSIIIGYTFYARKFWGTGVNFQVKKLMLDYIFGFVDLVKFQVGSENFRSRKAMEKIGGIIHGEHSKPNGEKFVEFWIKKENWM